MSQHQPSAATTRSQSKGLIKGLGGAKRISAISNADITSLVARRRATSANATVNRQLQLLGRALRHMSKFYAASIPDLDLRAAEVKEPKGRIRELSTEEQQRLFSKLPSDLHRAVMFCRLTGARIATMTDLKWTDIDFAKAEMTFRQKGDEDMTFPISREMQAFSSSLPKSQDVAVRRHVFTRLDKASGQTVRFVPKGGVFNSEFRTAVKAAGIEDFRFHDLRHTFATRMLRQTRDLKLVSKLLGHKSIETTARYAHVLVDDMRAALEDFSPLSGGHLQNFPQSVDVNI